MKLPTPGSRVRLMLDTINLHGPQTVDSIIGLFPIGSKKVSLGEAQKDLSNMVDRRLLSFDDAGYSLTYEAIALIEKRPNKKYVGIPAASPTRNIYAEPVKIHKHTQQMREAMVRR